MERAPSFFDLCFAGCADAEFKIGPLILSQANNRVCAPKKNVRGLLGLAVVLTHIEKWPGKSALGRTCRAVFL